MSELYRGEGTEPVSKIDREWIVHFLRSEASIYDSISSSDGVGYNGDRHRRAADIVEHMIASPPAPDRSDEAFASGEMCGSADVHGEIAATVSKMAEVG